MPDADERVERYILDHLRGDRDNFAPDSTARHLASCSETVVSDADARDGSYGCDTGCEYARFEAKVTCPHEPGGYEYHFGDFGELSYMLDYLDNY